MDTIIDFDKKADYTVLCINNASGRDFMPDKCSSMLFDIIHLYLPTAVCGNINYDFDIYGYYCDVMTFNHGLRRAFCGGKNTSKDECDRIIFYLENIKFNKSENVVILIFKGNTKLKYLIDLFNNVSGFDKYPQYNIVPEKHKIHNIIGLFAEGLQSIRKIGFIENIAESDQNILAINMEVF